MDSAICFLMMTEPSSKLNETKLVLAPLLHEILPGWRLLQQCLTSEPQQKASRAPGGGVRASHSLGAEAARLSEDRRGPEAL
jgi:hypothetical protein